MCVCVVCARARACVCMQLAILSPGLVSHTACLSHVVFTD